jgi:serine/threonine protein kinase
MHTHFIDFKPILSQLDCGHFGTPAAWYSGMCHLYTSAQSSETQQLNRDIFTQLLWQFQNLSTGLNVSTVSQWASEVENLFGRLNGLLEDCPYQFVLDRELLSVASSNRSTFCGTRAHVIDTISKLRDILSRRSVANPEEDIRHYYLGAFRDKIIDIDDFRELRELGRGFCSRVTLEEHIPSGRLIAVKTLQGVGSSQRRVECFCREVSILGLYRHQSLLPFFGFTNVGRSSDDELIIATDFMRNGTLRDVLNLEASGRVQSGWDNTKKSQVAFGVACGMKFLHACGVVHRDLKSLNILLDDDFEAKIGDLGLAKFLHDGEVHTMRIGSYPWMAPEVLHSEFYNEKADVYSYGMIVYELATLRYPFGECRDAKSIQYQVLNRRRPALDSSVPVSVSNLIRRCWSHDARERPSFAEIVAEFEDERCLFEDTSLDYFRAYRLKMSQNDATFKMNMIVAASHNFSEVVRGLIENGYSNVNETDSSGRTGLHIAVASGSIETVQVLVECRSVDVNIRSQSGQSSIHEAVMSGKSVCLRQLVVRADLDMNARDRDGNMALHLCVERGFEEAGSIIVSRRDTHVNAVNMCGETPLTLAAKSGNTSMLHKLIGTSRLKMGRPQHLYLLHKSNMNGQVEVVKLLVEIRGLDVNSKQAGRSALFLATASGRVDLVIAMLGAPQLDLSWEELSEVVSESIRSRNHMLLRMLLGFESVDMNSNGRDVVPAIVSAAAANNVEAVDILVGSSRINVNAQDASSGFTALHYAVQHQNVNMIKVLMNSGRVNVKVENKWKQTAAQLATSKSLRKLLKVTK